MRAIVGSLDGPEMIGRIGFDEMTELLDYEILRRAVACTGCTRYADRREKTVEMVPCGSLQFARYNSRFWSLRAGLPKSPGLNL
jgi:hypothetical protein